MRTTFAAVLASVSALLAACGGDDGGENPGPTSDARPVGDSAPASCTASASYTAVSDSFAGFASDPEEGDNLLFGGQLNSDALYDVLYIDLYSGFGVFPDSITTGEFQLTGEETNFASCGACVEIDTDIDAEAQAFGDIYFASGGTLNITSTSPNFTGTLTGATFVHSEIDQTTGETTAVGDGCESSIASLSFDVAVETDSMANGRVRIPVRVPHARKPARR